jgi:sulfide dehydrogenase cytochrome subunit
MYSSLCRAAVSIAILGASALAHAEDPNLARNLAAGCANCHGTNGQARGDMKALAGVPAEKIAALLMEYKRGALAGTVMPQIARGYTDTQLGLMAAYFAAQPPADGGRGHE